MNGSSRSSKFLRFEIFQSLGSKFPCKFDYWTSFQNDSKEYSAHHIAPWLPNMTTASKIYTGGCHCGMIRYSVEMDLTTDPVGGKCNCSSCLNRGILVLEVSPPSKFKLQSPPSLDNAQLGKYSPRGEAGTFHFYFCKTCGVNCFYQEAYKAKGEYPEWFRLNALSLDPDQGLDFTKFRMEYWDGKNNNWEGPGHVPYAGGTF